MRAVVGCVIAMAVTATASAADAREWLVGGPDADFPLIAPAIAAAAPHDLIRVRGGVYREDLIVDKPLAIRGEGRPVLFGTGAGSVVTILANGCELSGLTIEGSGAGQTNQMDAGVQIRSSNNRIIGNSLRRVFYGVVVVNAAHNEIADNEIAGFADLPFGRRGDGIYLLRSPENFVGRNRISGERDGIYFQYAPRGRAVDNEVSNSRYGLHDMFSDDARIVGNTFADSAVGANVMNSRRIFVARNRILRNRGVPGVGLTLKDCDDSTVEGNQLAENARGLLLDGSTANRFENNTFDANDTAVTLFSSAERNAFTGNDFTENWSDVVLNGRDSGTRWSIDGRGNHWSRYAGFDFEGDGVGESPHPVVGAFERVEGINPAVRLFLQSPAAIGLALAARLTVPTTADAVDEHPLVDDRRATSKPRAWLLALMVVSIALRRGVLPC